MIGLNNFWQQTETLNQLYSKILKIQHYFYSREGLKIFEKLLDYKKIFEEVDQIVTSLSESQGILIIHSNITKFIQNRQKMRIDRVKTVGGISKIANQAINQIDFFKEYLQKLRKSISAIHEVSNSKIIITRAILLSPNTLLPLAYQLIFSQQAKSLNNQNHPVERKVKSLIKIKTQFLLYLQNNAQLVHFQQKLEQLFSIEYFLLKKFQVSDFHRRLWSSSKKIQLSIDANERNLLSFYSNRVRNFRKQANSFYSLTSSYFYLNNL